MLDTGLPARMLFSQVSWLADAPAASTPWLNAGHAKTRRCDQVGPLLVVDFATYIMAVGIFRVPDDKELTPAVGFRRLFAMR
ncbi:hypothetical protein FSO04_43860 [Paraburkholderia madseniana]|uniref:Uncharacterized protein n=1 Tax=Paraburkholderia madseniana TaxID=2599607 RepID=A0A6N6W025_9BURK|nr:hypothetical protein [Paraburkholderia madseniana]KAE8753671.1 hypothetical protein FSO04_43860 [Paraburkholderia madseniana]